MCLLLFAAFLLLNIVQTKVLNQSHLLNEHECAATDVFHSEFEIVSLFPETFR